MYLLIATKNEFSFRKPKCYTTGGCIKFQINLLKWQENFGKNSLIKFLFLDSVYIVMYRKERLNIKHLHPLSVFYSNAIYYDIPPIPSM